MRRISVDTLTPIAALPRPVFHECGAMLLAAGDRLGEEEIALLRRSGIRRIYDVGADAEVGEETRTGPADPREPEVAPDEVRSFRRERRAAAAARAIERAARLAEGRLILDPRGELRNGGIDRAVARSRAGELPEGTPWKDRLDDIRPLAPRPPREKAAALKSRASTVDRLTTLFTALRAGDGVPDDAGGRFVSDIVRDLCGLAVCDPDLAVALALDRPGAPDAPEDPARLLARHSFDVAVLAIATAIELGYALEQIVEIAHAALLHDVGMVRLPEALALKPGALDDDERRELEKHPVHAIEVLRRFPEVPVAVAAVAIEEHERPDGSGYPRGTSESGELARIVAVADVFQAISASRPHRPARAPHAAVREIVALGARKKLDTKILRALLKSISLYPVGSYLKLSDGSVVRVVRSGGPDASRPCVAVIGATAPPELLDLAARPELRVVETDLPAGATGGLTADDVLVGF